MYVFLVIDVGSRSDLTIGISVINVGTALFGRFSRMRLRAPLMLISIKRRASVRCSSFRRKTRGRRDIVVLYDMFSFGYM